MNRLVEGLTVVTIFAALTIFFTYPLPFHLGSLVYRVDSSDGQFSIWNVAWVARTLVRDPFGVFDANIFYPELGTLAYSEANLGSGLLAVPVYWATGNPYAAHASVVLLSFFLSGLATYALIRYLTGDRLASLVGAIAFAFAPHLFAHLLHIQLLWTAGLPFGLLMYHRLVDRPSLVRGVALGLAVSAQVYLCAYYGVFLVLVVGAFVLGSATYRRLWSAGTFWRALAAAAATALVTALPLLIPVLRFQQTTGFSRPLAAAGLFSANWSAYLASAATAHGWWLAYLPRWNEVLFPGLIALAFGLFGGVSGLKAKGRMRETTLLYAGLGLLAVWASLGPEAGLYRWLYAIFPPMSLMRAPSRFGVVVLFACAVLCGVGVGAFPPRRRWPTFVGAMLVVGSIAEHSVPLAFTPSPRPDRVYLKLADLPHGPLLEVPVYSHQAGFLRARYMLASTAHWMPLVNAYSDYIPPAFQARLDALGGFPSRDSLRDLSRDRVRYVVIHLDAFNAEQRSALEGRLKEFATYLQLLYRDERTQLYEISAYSE